MVADPIHRSEFAAEVRRLDQADAYNAGRLDAHIANSLRSETEIKATISSLDSKLDQVLENQNRIRGRDGVILVLVMAIVTICTGVITASILGVIR